MNLTRIRRILLPAFVLVIAATAITYLVLVSQDDGDSALEASGTVEAVEVIVASEMAGRVRQVYVGEGDQVQPGDLLFILEDDLLLAQRERAVAALEAAEARLQSAEVGLESSRAALRSANLNLEAAHLQLEMALDLASQNALAERLSAWTEAVPDEFILPVWYFQKIELLQSAEEEARSSREALEVEEGNLAALLEDMANTDIIAAESRLRDAQAEFLIAQDVLDQAEAQSDPEIEDFARTSFEAARDELEAAQSAYEELLSNQSEEELLEARARLAVARQRHERALDRLRGLRTGEHALSVRAAELGLQQAEAALLLAEINLEQAQTNRQHFEKALEQTRAEIRLLDVQMEKLEIHAHVVGTIRTRSVEPGEVLPVGAVAMTIDRTDTLTIKVFIAEDRYGQILLGDHAQVKVDSFPGEIFNATVTRIADQAEFTPRNVQTEEGRRTTVFAVELSVDDPSQRLKPGMPADVSFSEPVAE